MKTLKYNLTKRFQVILLAVFLSAGFFGFGGIPQVLAGQCQVSITSADYNPHDVRFNQPVTITGTVSFAGSVMNPPGTSNAGYCNANNGNIPVQQITVAPLLVGQSFTLPSATINVTPSTQTTYNFSVTFTPSALGLQAGKTINLLITVSLPGFGQLTSTANAWSITLDQGVYASYGCQMDNGIYACSPGNLSNCSDASACQGRPCVQLSNSDSCKAVYACVATNGQYACSNSATDSGCVNTQGCDATGKSQCKLVPLTSCGSSAASSPAAVTPGTIANGQACTPGNDSLCQSNFCVDNNNGTGTCEACTPGTTGNQQCNSGGSTGFTCSSSGICVTSSSNPSTPTTVTTPTSPTTAAATPQTANCTGSNPDPNNCLYNPLPVDSLVETLLIIMRAFLGGIGIWAVVFIIIGGFRYVMSQGNEEAVTAARKTITWAIIGFAIAMLAFSIMAIVQNILQVKVQDVISKTSRLEVRRNIS